MKNEIYNDKILQPVHYDVNNENSSLAIQDSFEKNCVCVYTYEKRGIALIFSIKVRMV
jgi:hypothetical protein